MEAEWKEEVERDVEETGTDREEGRTGEQSWFWAKVEREGRENEDDLSAETGWKEDQGTAGRGRDNDWKKERRNGERGEITTEKSW